MIILIDWLVLHKKFKRFWFDKNDFCLNLKFVYRKDSMEFLQDIVPKKIKYSEYLEIMEKENQVEDNLY